MSEPLGGLRPFFSLRSSQAFHIEQGERSPYAHTRPLAHCTYVTYVDPPRVLPLQQRQHIKQQEECERGQLVLALIPDERAALFIGGCMPDNSRVHHDRKLGLRPSGGVG